MVKIPVPTNGVRVEVKTEDDWTRNVMIAPMASAMYLIKMSVTLLL
jgi:hypothetical protein